MFSEVSDVLDMPIIPMRYIVELKNRGAGLDGEMGMGSKGGRGTCEQRQWVHQLDRRSEREE